MAEQTTSGPPYLPSTAGLGGLPVPKVDDPICGVLLPFFIVGAVTNMTIFRINLRRGHKFGFSAMTFGFCMARISALVMRIVWASRPHNANVAIAASIFTLAGVVLLFLFNIIFSQRIVRAYRPLFGWSRPVTYVFRFLAFSVLGCLIMLIIASVYSFFTLSPSIHLIVRKIQLVGSTWFTLLAFLPMPIVLLSRFAPPAPPTHGDVEHFGRGRLNTKTYLLFFTSFLLTLGAGFRCGVAYKVRPIYNPAWYHSKTCYYCFNYVIEIIVVYTYTFARFDQRFHIPDGSSAPGHYAGGGKRVGDGEKAFGEAENTTSGVFDHVNAENEVFGSDSESPSAPAGEQSAEAWDARARRELQKEKEGDPA